MTVRERALASFGAEALSRAGGAVQAPVTVRRAAVAETGEPGGA